MFVPRTVKKKQGPKSGQQPSSLAGPPPPSSTAGAPSTSSSSTSSLPSPAIAPARPSTADVAKGKAPVTASVSEAKNAELQAVALLELVFSDHALCTKDDLHLVARSNQNEGYIPLTYLLSNHPLLSSLATLPHPTLTRALRQHGTPGLLRTRLALTEPRAWGGTKSYGEPGIEVGRCDWGTEQARSGKSQEPGEERTLYLENLPPHLRSYPPVLLFLNSLFKSPSSTSIQPVVKSLSFDGPIFRNFVWIVLRDEAVSQSVLKEWSWGGAVGRGKRAAKEVEGVSKETQEARDAGLRVLEKVEHSRLEQEYVAHLATFPSTTFRPPRPSTSASTSSFVHDQPPHAHSSSRPPNNAHAFSYNPPKATTSFKAPSPPFPSSCLLYLRNVDPQTSKTALKTLFNSVLAEGKEIDYVDWVKGSDSCHLRLSTPSLASHLLNSLISIPVYHISPSEPPILAELVSGERERIYWMNIKESIRLDAVRIAALDVIVPENGSSSSQVLPTSIFPPVSRQPSSDYPSHCLLFAKGLDPDSSSKTSLKELFNSGLRSDETISKGLEVTYVDWSKGLDTCYLRLPHPSLASLLLSYFASSDSKIALEMVEGERESIYWRANVKESIRREAARVAVGDLDPTREDTREDGKGGKRRKKM